jgi:hypothetical protein
MVIDDGPAFLRETGRMVYPANVVHVFIASPSDVARERQALREAIWEFNDEHTADTRVVLIPRLWEKNSTPHIGAPPQAILDDQIVDSSDIVIAIFWTRIGQLLDDGKHATVHELERIVEAGKPALLYFSNTPVVPDSLDPEQYKAVQAFKKEIGTRSLYREYSGIAELVEHARRDLLATVRRHFNLPVEGSPSAPRRTVILSARVERRGRDAYLIVENRGPGDARNVTVSWVNESIEEGFEPPWTHDMEEPISTLTEGSAFEYSLLLHSGTSDRADLHIQWDDDQGPHEKVQTLSL